MNGGGRKRRWKNLKQRLGFKGMGCCGATWSFADSNMSIRDEETHIQEPHDDEQESIVNNMGTTTTPTTVGQIPAHITFTGSYNVGQSPAASSGMNLATALAAERNLRATVRGPVKSLKRLIEESDGVYSKKRKEVEEREEGGSDGVCCVCMERSKGAAFIPCGHTFCRVCSREVWVNRGTCPICNRSILEILDIF